MSFTYFVGQNHQILEDFIRGIWLCFSIIHENALDSSHQQLSHYTLLKFQSYNIILVIILVKIFSLLLGQNPHPTSLTRAVVRSTKKFCQVLLKKCRALARKKMSCPTLLRANVEPQKLAKSQPTALWCSIKNVLHSVVNKMSCPS